MLFCLMGRVPGVPPTIQTWLGGTWGTPPTIQDWGTPHPDLEYPSPSRPRVPCTIQTWPGGTSPTIQTWGTPPNHPPSRHGVPPIQTWDGVPLTIQTWDGVPPPASQNVNRQTPVKTVPSLVLHTRAVITQKLSQILRNHLELIQFIRVLLYRDLGLEKRQFQNTFQIELSQEILTCLTDDELSKILSTSVYILF